MTVTKSFSVEFDDALLDLDGWKNPRYDGSKLTGQKINEYNNGDVTYGKNPVLTNKTVALYIGNTLIGGEDEDEQYAYIKKHSYVDINRILIINPETDKLTLLDATQEGFNSFHRFVTNDLPTGGSFNIRLLDYSIPNSLNANTQNYVKMNKGWLLKSFKYGEFINDNSSATIGLEYSGSLALFKQLAWSLSSPFPTALVFQYGLKSGGSSGVVDFSPSYVSASIKSNKFTDQYYNGAYTFPSFNTSTSGSFVSASKFIGTSTINFLVTNSLSTELHLTLFKGEFDFAPSFNDERSIGTFEVDRKLTSVGTSSFLDNAPLFPLLSLKGQTGSRFWPTRPATSSQISAVDVDNMKSFEDNGSSKTVAYIHQSFISSQPTDMPLYDKSETFQGEFTYELSFLDKSHTLIADIDKESSLPNGIGEKGFVIIPQQLDKRVKLNIDYYLSKAGLIDETFTKIINT